MRTFAQRPLLSIPITSPLPRAVLAGLLTATLLCANVAQARQERVEGIDVSRFQGTIDWARVATTNVEFAFIQASRGSGRDCLVVPSRCGPDEYYTSNYAGATANGIRAGAYHRAFTGGNGRTAVRLDARREAKVFLGQVVALGPADLLPVLDVEAPFGGLDQRELRIWIRTWMEKVGTRLGVKPIVYTNRSSWLATGDTTSFARRGHPLWVANFGVSAPAVPAANWDGHGWAVWQYTSTGRVPGIRGDVDRDVLAVPIEAVSVPAGATP